MWKVAILLSCVALPCNGRRVQRELEQMQGDLYEDNRIAQAQELNALAMLLLGLDPAGGYQVPGVGQSQSSRASSSIATTLSRRATLQQAVGAATAAVLAGSAAPARAGPVDGGDDGGQKNWQNFDKMGGMIEPYSDTTKGFKLYKPFGFTQFEGASGDYDVKWQDIIQRDTTVVVSSSPVKTAKDVSALGDLETVGKKFAAKRGGELVDSFSRAAAGIPTYTFEIKGPDFHEIILLSVNNGKLFRLNLVSGNKKWKNWEKMYKNIAASFVPQGF